ncbi:MULTISPECIES: alpha/beta fold hydrolase [Psychrilyobacter]|uniref:Alpha/beta fold hydrolase n=1 Tax=Psychrilyobacter piezotolerans TaxID=2293438 RepID=A0ABX9KHZ5_9FUSO|nr:MULTISPECIES: alpha/beta fold hydrolase [Psychrilyobacter]MCS5422981.1 alpha/beta fold hydrolase [Psychrilyobacter sp. S5]NDI77504.1 alpha/beta hydrolase [Psychrilyobacter piezotolerans]RDE62983.1 alpha/beta fold hydrolase [Psychrilyobacter sp. S5]REI41741.1 alpha/beta fold hydrolase [Psychrilyobacter piezotolerans]
MSTYILVHGAWHGGWCWDKVVSLLKEKGHKVLAPDLPGHEQKDPIPPGQITLQDYVDKLCKVLDEQSEPVYLVGHSMGGAVITQTAEFRPDKIKKLVYVSAFLLQNGESLTTIASVDEDTLLFPNTAISEDKAYATVGEDLIKKIFFGDCSHEDVERAKSLLTNQPAAPLITPVETTSENFGRVSRIYISCTHDRAISPSAQKKMYTNSPCEKVIKMNTSHSPFLAAPDELAGHLLSL